LVELGDQFGDLARDLHESLLSRRLTQCVDLRRLRTWATTVGRWLVSLRDSGRTLVLADSHGTPLVRYGAGLGPYYRPSRPTRLIAATADPAVLKADASWFTTCNVSLAEADAAEVYRLYRPRDWVEHYYRPVGHELGWIDHRPGEIRVGSSGRPRRGPCAAGCGSWARLRL
jgi:hypothetical protein